MPWMSLPVLDVLVSLIGLEIGRALSGSYTDAGDEDRAVLDRLSVAVGGLVPTEPPIPTSHPAVDRWLDPAVSAAPEEQRPLAEAFRSVSPYLVWKTAYAGAPTSPAMRRFWTNYAYASLVSPSLVDGRESPLQSPEMNLYLVVQGAGVTYGRHHHPAIEVYGIVSGTARWLRGDGGFLARSPGNVFVHHPDVVHATTTGADPTISWAAWLGDLQSCPVLETSDGPVVTA